MNHECMYIHAADLLHSILHDRFIKPRILGLVFLFVLVYGRRNTSHVHHKTGVVRISVCVTETDASPLDDVSVCMYVSVSVSLRWMPAHWMCVV